MSGGPLSTQEITLQDPVKALSEIKDTAILLCVANEYLCEEAFLEKMGFVLNHNLEILERHVKNLRGQFVGKPPRDIDLEPQLKDIAQIADLFQNANDGIKKLCVEGTLGLDLAEKFSTLTEGIETLKGMLEGKSVAYTKADSFKRTFGKLRFIFVLLAAAYKFAIRIMAFLVLLSLLTFTYLYVTMEKEADVLNEIERNTLQIEENQALYTQHNAELKTIKKQIETLENKVKLNRQQEVQLMELNLKAYKLEEEQGQAKIEENHAQTEKEKCIKKLEEMRRKSFLERILRR